MTQPFPPQPQTIPAPQPAGPQPQWFQAPDGSWHPVMTPPPAPPADGNKATRVLAGILAFVVIAIVLGIFVAAFASV